MPIHTDVSPSHGTVFNSSAVETSLDLHYLTQLIYNTFILEQQFSLRLGMSSFSTTFSQGTMQNKQESVQFVPIHGTRYYHH
jgi:hypothetical protein